MQQTALILGGNGRFGRHMAQALTNAGWATRHFNRAADRLWDAAWGAQIIVNGWNPPYPNWEAEFPGLTTQVIEVATASGATIIQPGNVYVFGANAPAEFNENTAHAATNPLGRIRVEMEATLRASGARCILLRAGDFLDTEASGNWFDRIMTPQLGKGRFIYPGRADIPHAWAYLPDLARAAVALADQREGLATFEDVPFPGYSLTGQDLAEAIAGVTARKVAVAPFNWAPLHLARPFWPMAKNLLEMRYLWDKPHTLDGAKFNRLLPGFQATPLNTALASALQVDVHPDQAVA